jgi:hypothetical protein
VLREESRQSEEHCELSPTYGRKCSGFRCGRVSKLSEHRDAIALLEALIQEALDEYEEGGTPKLWRDLSRTWRRAEAARVAWDPKKWREAYVQLGMLINRGKAQSDRFDRLIRLLADYRKLVDSEIERRHAEATTFTLEEAEAFYTGIGKAVRRYVLDPHMTDEEKLVAITNDIAVFKERFGIHPNEAGPG